MSIETTMMEVPKGERSKILSKTLTGLLRERIGLTNVGMLESNKGEFPFAIQLPFNDGAEEFVVKVIVKQINGG